ncbi:MAG TPA: hypothetical protein DEH78_14135 [Solibacterales bacterium]|nr:hypothetical protein [Bryobacterales bacterium]
MSIANLVFLRSWADLMRMRSQGVAGTEQGRALLWATILSVLALGAVIFAARWWLERRGQPGLLTFGRCAALALCITPIDYLDGHIRPIATQWMSQIAFVGLWTAVLMVPILGAVQLLVYRKPGLYRGLRRLVLALSPAVLLLPVNLAWSALKPGAVPPAPKLAGPVPKPTVGRLVWLVFDEFDYHLSFAARPPSIEMPELDRLRKGAFFAQHALPSSWETESAMTGYLLGEPVAKFEDRGSRFEAVLAKGGRVEPGGATTVLTKARAWGADTYIAGWHLPYCQMMGRQLTGCAEPTPAAIRTASLGRSFAEQWSAQYREHWMRKRFDPSAQFQAPWFGWAERQDQYRGFQQLLAEGKRFASGDGARFVLMHFPIPHPLGIWDREKNELSLKSTSNTIDNLELVDWTVGEIRRAMEHAGVWESAAVIVTADHPLRPDYWAPGDVWSEEERRLTGNQRRERIPCLIKPPGSASGLDSAVEFRSAALSQLSLALLRGEVSTVEGIEAFLARSKDLAGLR